MFLKSHAVTVSLAALLLAGLGVLADGQSHSSTLNPWGACGHASWGLGIMFAGPFGPLSTEGVAKGAGRSATESLRRVPGFSWE